MQPSEVSHVGAFRNLMVWGHFPRITQCKERNFDGYLFECCFNYGSFWEHHSWKNPCPDFRLLRNKHSSIFPSLGTLLSLRGRDARCGFAGFCQQAGLTFPSVFLGWTFLAFRNLCLEHVWVPTLKMGGFVRKIHLSQVVARRRLTVFLKMWDEFVWSSTH